MQTAKLRDEPGHLTPGGDPEIRELVTSPQGEISQVVRHRGQVEQTTWLHGLIETLYTHARRGEIWIHEQEHETTEHAPQSYNPHPARASLAGPRRPDDHITLFVAVTPRPGTVHELGEAPAKAEGPARTGDLPPVADDAAPDGSEIRPSPESALGGLLHGTLDGGSKTMTARRKSVVELWSTLSGAGELALWVGAAENQPLCVVVVQRLRRDTDGCALPVPRDQGGPLRLLILTMPRWPGGRGGHECRAPRRLAVTREVRHRGTRTHQR